MRRVIALVLALLAGSAFAQGAGPLFGPKKPPLYKEQELDRRFKFSKVHTMLKSGNVPGIPCLQLTGALLVALGELAPYLHKRDENFVLDPSLLQSFSAQMDSPRFPGTMYLSAMVRRVLIDGKMPREWLTTAASINQSVQIIDIARLRYLADGVRHVDSAYFTFDVFLKRFNTEVGSATSASATTASMGFRDNYLDREVAWGALTLVDVGPESRAPIKGKRGTMMVEAGGIVAHLKWKEPGEEPFNFQMKGMQGVGALFGETKKFESLITARLVDNQYVDIYSIPKGSRVLVKGRLFEINGDLTKVILRDAFIFQDRDWSQGAMLADPNVMLRCPAAINDVTGSGTYQPGGFGQH